MKEKIVQRDVNCVEIWENDIGLDLPNSLLIIEDIPKPNEERVSSAYRKMMFIRPTAPKAFSLIYEINIWSTIPSSIKNRDSMLAGNANRSIWLQEHGFSSWIC